MIAIVGSRDVFLLRVVLAIDKLQPLQRFDERDDVTVARIAEFLGEPEDDVRMTVAALATKGVIRKSSLSPVHWVVAHDTLFRKPCG